MRDKKYKLGVVCLENGVIDPGCLVTGNKMYLDNKTCYLYKS